MLDCHDDVALAARAPIAAAQWNCAFMPERARMVLSLVHFGGDFETFMTMAEVAAVRELYNADPCGSITFGAVVRRIAACEAAEFRLPAELVIWKALPLEARVQVTAQAGPHLNDRIAVVAENLREYAASAGIVLPDEGCAASEEGDGQPDEAQEWADFDPDC